MTASRTGYRISFDVPDGSRRIDMWSAGTGENLIAFCRQPWIVRETCSATGDTRTVRYPGLSAAHRYRTESSRALIAGTSFYSGPWDTSLSEDENRARNAARIAASRTASEAARNVEGDAP